MTTYTAIANYDMLAIDQQAQKFLTQHAQLSTSDRLQQFCQTFLHVPYRLRATGEGVHGLFDQQPLFRFDCFDCLSFVNTLLALASSRQIDQFYTRFVELSYCHSQVNYIQRRQFMCVDWNLPHQQAGYLQDITTDIRLSISDAIHLTAQAYVDRPNWLRTRNLADLKLLPQSKIENPDILLSQLKARHIVLQAESSAMNYLPLSLLFDSTQQVNIDLLQQIPHASVIEIVRPNWDQLEQEGTHLNVSHLGFAFWEQGQLWFYHASSIVKKVVRILLSDYLVTYGLNIPTVQGIHVQKILG